MATTQELVTWVLLELHGWNAEGVRGVLPLLNEAHKLLLTHETEYNLLYDQTTGDFPFVTTTATAFRYNCPANVWKIAAILIDADQPADYNQVAVASGYPYPWVFEDYLLAGKLYRRVVNMRSQPSRGNTVAWFQFTGVTPGATTGIFRRAAYRKPVEITSTNIQHEMPDGTDMSYLLPATMALIEGINDHGKTVQARVWIEGTLKPALWNELNRGEYGGSSFVTKRPF